MAARLAEVDTVVTVEEERAAVVEGREVEALTDEGDVELLLDAS